MFDWFEGGMWQCMIFQIFLFFTTLYRFSDRRYRHLIQRWYICIISTFPVPPRAPKVSIRNTGGEIREALKPKRVASFWLGFLKIDSQELDGTATFCKLCWSTMGYSGNTSNPPAHLRRQRAWGTVNTETKRYQACTLFCRTAGVSAC